MPCDCSFPWSCLAPAPRRSASSTITCLASRFKCVSLDAVATEINIMILSGSPDRRSDAEPQRFDPWPGQVADDPCACDLDPGVQCVRRIAPIGRPYRDHYRMGDLPAAQHPAERHCAGQAFGGERQPPGRALDLRCQAPSAPELAAASRCPKAERTAPALERTDGHHPLGAA